MRTNQSQAILDLATQIILLDTKHNAIYFQGAKLDALFSYIKIIQCAMSKTYNIEYNAQRLNEQAIEAFKYHAIAGCCIAMRHGEQESGYAAGLNDEETKIIQMRSAHNINDLMTERSAIEFIATMFIFKYMKDKFSIEFLIESSENQRALQPAKALAKLLETNCKINLALSCVNYPDNTILPDDQLKTILEKGTLPWQQKAIDRVCGNNTFNYITQNMSQLFSTETLQKNQVRLKITHTQQINAVCEMLKLAINRFGYFGFVGLDQLSRVFSSDQGLYCLSAPQTDLFKKNNLVVSDISTLGISAKL